MRTARTTNTMQTTLDIPEARYRKGLPATLVIVSLFVAFAALSAFGSGGFRDTRRACLTSLSLAFSSLILFLIFHTGRVHRWRRVFFTTYAVAFVISFVWWTAGDRGHMWLLDEETLYSQAPMCHIVVPMLVLPVLFTKEIIFPTSMAGASFMLLVVAVLALVYGRGFCSWGCFFGGQDELFASLRRKTAFRIRTLAPSVRYFSFALLVFIVLHSFATLTPTYCWWLCPFKTGSEFIEVNSFMRALQTFLFVSLWAVLVVFLPLVSKKRTQCGLFCPMGAFLSCTSRINLFGLKLDSQRCRQCNRCLEACPTFSLTKESYAAGRPAITCTKCGACIDVCPEGALAFHALGAPATFGARRTGSTPADVASAAPRAGFWRRLGTDLWDPGVVFIFGIFTVGTVMASSYFVDVPSRLLRHFFGI
jgi:ferredoxin-type protein NapH